MPYACFVTELLLLNVNRDLKETLKNTAISELLFGTEQLPQKDEESSSSSSLSSQKQQQEKTPILGVSRLCGRLSLFSQRWKDLGFHRQVISSPVQRIAPIEPKRSQKESDAIDSSIENLPHEGILSLVSPCKGQFISNVFIVPRSDGSSRLVLNLKSFNEFVKTSHFKLGTHKTVSQVITPNCYMSNIDFKDAYYLVPIYNAHKKYLRFCFNGSTYEYNCFPFGLSCAPQIFTKILKPVVSHLRKRNLLSVIYLDDFLLLGVTLEECALTTRETIGLLEHLGFLINYKKSSPNPDRICNFLGFQYNSCTMTISLPEKKRAKLKKLLERFSTRKTCVIRVFKICWQFSLSSSSNSICFSVH
nr:unnamed protein product [Callosobruchus chinensis]